MHPFTGSGSLHVVMPPRVVTRQWAKGNRCKMFRNINPGGHGQMA